VEGPEAGRRRVPEADAWRSTAILLLQTGGDVDEALRWMEHFGREYGFFDENFSIEDFKKLLEETGEARRTPRGFEMTPRGERRIRQDSLNEIFSTLRAGSAGDHRTPVAGTGGERLSETRRWQFGDDLANLDPLASVNNAVKRAGIGRAHARRGRPRGL
jgi:hypothetical protein